MLRLALLLPLWLAVVMGDSGYVHACPRHGGAAARGAHATGHQAHHQSPSDAGHRACSCIGGCCVPTVAALPGAAWRADDAAAPIHAVADAPRSSRASSGAQFGLPWANAPPTLADFPSV